MCLLRSAIIVWELIVVQIALCKSPFNVTFFSFHETGMSHQKRRLKFHYWGGFGHELKVKAWQHPANMSPKIIRLIRITKDVKMRCPTAAPPFAKICICWHLAKIIMLHLTPLTITTLHLFSLLSLQVNFTLLTSLTCYCSLDSLKHSQEYILFIYFAFIDNVWHRNSASPPNQLSSPPVATDGMIVGPNM